jgi:hypothetical protein
MGKPSYSKGEVDKAGEALIAEFALDDDTWEQGLTLAHHTATRCWPCEWLFGAEQRGLTIEPSSPNV